MSAPSQTIEEILCQAVDIESPVDREKYLASACAGRDELRREVERLVQFHFAAGGFFDEPNLRATTMLGFDDDHAGLVLGRYAMLEQIGEGSFGVVYRAEQREPVRRFVALKLLKPGMDSHEVVTRFEAERQALALMDHPHIARVYDAGTTDEGRPYFVMELVRGVPITQYADHSHLATKDRLNLFVKVCQAVQHAHQKGIIHRDLKPTNVLVAMHDGGPLPKVIDFGVAKAINQQLTQTAVHTQFAQLVGTPLYMSPEQADMSPMEVDTRSDIYSLGVLLYELLTGTTPLAKDRLNAVGFDELRRIIREEEPVIPSARLSTLGNLSDTVAENRRTDHRRLTNLVRGELDWIVMKALEKDRTRRYETADGLARDIERYLHDEPVEACPPSAMYRIRKFAQRNRTALALTAIVLLLAFSGLTVSTLLIANERDAATKSAVDAKDAAKRESLAAAAAIEAGNQARHEQREAVKERNLALENLYFAHMQLARQDWESGQINRMHEILDAHRANGGEPELRGWEWYYLLSLCHRDRQTLRGHTAEVMSLCQSPDGRRIASGSSDFTVRIWDLEAGRETAVMRGHEKDVVSLAWCQPGQRIVSGSYDGHVIVWDAETGTKTHDFKPFDCVFAVACSPDGKTIAAGGSFPFREPGEKRVEGAVILWNVEDGKKLMTLIPEDDCQMVRSLCFTPDGKFVLAGENFHGQLRVWDPVSGKLVQTIKVHDHVTMSIACSADGKRFATTSVDQTLRVWEMETWKNLHKVSEAHRGMAQCVCWSPDGKQIATAGEDGFVKIWDAETGREFGSLRGHRGPATSVVWRPDGQWLVSGSGDKTIKEWNTTIEQGPRTLDGQWVAAWNPDGRLLAADGKNKKGETRFVSLFNVETGDVVVRLPYEGEYTISGIAWSPDGNRIAVTLPNPGRVCVWDIPTRKVVMLATAHAETASSVEFSRDNRLLVTSGVDAQIHVWSIDSGKIIQTLKGHNSKLGSVRFNPAGDRIASASWQRELKIWEWQTGRRVFEFERPGIFQADGQSSVAWSPSGGRLAAGCANGDILVWNAETGREELAMHGHTSHLRSISWSPDGKRLASGGFDRFLKIWDAESGRELLSLPGHRTTLNCVTWSPDGKRIATTDGGRVKIWDATQGFELARGTTPR